MTLRPPPSAPPIGAVWLLARLLPSWALEPILGDMAELFEEAVISKGDRAARAWYWRETFRVLLTLRPDRAERGAQIRSHPSGDSPVHDVIADLRFGARLLFRRPGYAALVILTLAIGIGASTAIFSVVDPVLFQPLPYPHPDRIMMIWERGTDGTASNTSFATYTDIAQQNRSFEAVAAVRDWSPTMTGPAEPERLTGARVSQPYLDALGVRPTLGRDFRPAEDSPAAEHVVILSNGLWRRRFGGDSGLVGRSITLEGEPYTVVGIMPAGFENVLMPDAQLWAPLRYDATLPWACRTCRHLRAVARLKPEVSQPQAARDLDMLSTNLVRAYPTDYPNAGMILRPLKEEITRGIRPALLAVFGAVGLLLLIACANVTSLQLARAAQREGEFTVRAALGAGRRRVLRQLLTESLLLALLGGTLGFGIANLGLALFQGATPADLPRLAAIHLDLRVLAFALVITTVTGIVSGLLPAVHALRPDLHDAIKRTGRRTGGHRHATRSALVVTEVAVAIILLVGAGLLLRSLKHLVSVNPGFDPAHLLTMEVQTAGPRYSDDAPTHAFFTNSLAAVAALPGVESAAITSQLPLGGNQDGYGVHIEAKPQSNPELDPSADRYAVSPGYVEAMRIPVLRGRSLTPQDGPDAPSVMLINATFARRLWAGEDPIGQRVRVGAADKGPWRTIVGIVGDVHHESLDAEQTNQIYLPELQWPWADNLMVLVVRARGDLVSLAPAVRSAIWSVDKDQPILKVATMDRVLAASTARRRFLLVLFGAFAGVALILAAAGIYGVLAGSVAERSREIGIRSALGASRAGILGLIVRQGLGLTGTGVVIGLLGALALGRLISGLLFQVQATDPSTYISVAAILFLVAVLACWVPAWRAARADPAVTLRAE